MKKNIQWFLNLFFFCFFSNAALALTTDNTNLMNMQQDNVIDFQKLIDSINNNTWSVFADYIRDCKPNQFRMFNMDAKFRLKNFFVRSRATNIDRNPEFVQKSREFLNTMSTDYQIVGWENDNCIVRGRMQYSNPATQFYFGDVAKYYKESTTAINLECRLPRDFLPNLYAIFKKDADDLSNQQIIFFYRLCKITNKPVEQKQPYQMIAHHINPDIQNLINSINFNSWVDFSNKIKDCTPGTFKLFSFASKEKLLEYSDTINYLKLEWNNQLNAQLQKLYEALQTTYQIMGFKNDTCVLKVDISEPNSTSLIKTSTGQTSASYQNLENFLQLDCFFSRAELPTVAELYRNARETEMNWDFNALVKPHHYTEILNKCVIRTADSVERHIKYESDIKKLSDSINSLNYTEWNNFAKNIYNCTTGTFELPYLNAQETLNNYLNSVRYLKLQDKPSYHLEERFNKLFAAVQMTYTIVGWKNDKCVLQINLPIPYKILVEDSIIPFSNLKYPESYILNCVYDREYLPIISNLYEHAMKLEQVRDPLSEGISPSYKEIYGKCVKINSP